MKRLNMLALVLTFVSVWVGSVYGQTIPPLPFWRVSVYFFVLPSYLDPNRAAIDQSAMDYMLSGGNGVLTNTHLLQMWRATDTITTPPDSTNIYGGTCIGIGILKEQRTAKFYATDVNVRVWSSDVTNVFTGQSSMDWFQNLGIDPFYLTPTTFSPNLHGQTWDAEGRVINLCNGEDVTTWPIVRLATLLRQGYICNSADEVAQSLTYFATNMPMTLNVDVWTKFYDHETNSINSFPLLVPARGGAGTNMTWTLQGQRQIPSVHYGVRSWQVWGGTPSVLFSNIQDGFQFTSTPDNSGSQGFYQVYQY